MNNIPSSVEVVCQTEYQDIYRIKPYILLVVDKFTLGDPVYYRSNHLSQYTKPYSKYTESGLRIDKDPDIGKVYYYDRIAYLASSNNYRFKLKTSGDAFNGNVEEFCSLVECCNRIVKSYYKVTNDKYKEECKNE